ncbi:MAG: phosphoribosylamine--glycine ligase [Lutibacter sp.]|uniref:phosphoribosylamine--glycine ligase n=1 Tax=Lutibacter sp. TaxID=1925666 RepID=UPI001843E60F|nr:phosphoribosylamine--glycine ligase [Lutibacter sp.]MBT8317943.1 phosphoribosylamine--glycine ligase [Lutibacter sp.]NNJ58801.1 phosphoribosylamine--glycine ligase [Lutibacter sp.]
MNVLILGAGGREHALSWKIAQSELLTKLFIAPGNAGTLELGTNVMLDPNDFEAVKKVVLKNNIELVIVGPEDPLVKGIHDFFLNDETLKSVAVIGPEKYAAQLEGSKEFAKEFMSRHHIPTAAYKSFTSQNLEEGYQFLETLNKPYVLKADGLAGGKGVLILNDLQEAKDELKEMLTNQKFGAASSKVVIEEFLDGIELSCFVLTDGKSYVNFPNAKDYKRIGEGDIGLNTGGMGAVSPVPFADDDFMQKIEERVIKPTIEGLQKDSIPYKGFIFFGIIKVGNEPKVIEYNCRMGDPETEVVIPRIKSDLLELLIAAGQNELHTKTINFEEDSACTVMLVSGGYPEAYEKGKEIHGLEKVKNSIAFHAGTTIEKNKIITNGGRVIAITSYGNNFRSALNQSYQNIEKISFDKMNFRTDIGFDL